MTEVEAELDSKQQEILLAEWQTCVEMANATSGRRDTMNNLFVTINVALTAAISYIWDVKTVILTIAGVVLCVVWLLFIRYYKQLSTAKYDVIIAIERRLPEQPFDNEWQQLQKHKGYIQGTTLERILPIAFIVVYAAIMISILFIHITANIKP